MKSVEIIDYRNGYIMIILWLYYGYVMVKFSFSKVFSLDNSYVTFNSIFKTCIDFLYLTCTTPCEKFNSVSLLE